MAEEQVKEVKYKEQILRIAELSRDITRFLKEIDDVEVRRSVLAVTIKALLLNNENDLFVIAGILDTVKFDISIGSYLQSHAQGLIVGVPVPIYMPTTQNCNAQNKEKRDSTYI